MSENQNQNQKLFWSPEAQITISGREFEALVRLTELAEYPLAQLSTREMFSFFLPALEASKEILTRMKEDGTISSEESK